MLAQILRKNLKMFQLFDQILSKQEKFLKKSEEVVRGFGPVLKDNQLICAEIFY